MPIENLEDYKRSLWALIEAEGMAESRRNSIGLDYETMIDVLVSKRTHVALHTDSEVEDWLTTHIGLPRMISSIVPIDKIERWSPDPETGNITHDSGMFFEVTGVHVRHRSPLRDTEWDQPLLEQPEIGILGIAVTMHQGVLHLCLQAKEEPGNINSIQLAPTIQATYSNRTQVHGGTLPRYVEMFVSPQPEQIMSMRLQTEDGGRFLYKSNRNIILRVRPDELNPLPDNFIWLTLRQIRWLLMRSNLVNYCARSVLSTFI